MKRSRAFQAALLAGLLAVPGCGAPREAPAGGDDPDPRARALRLAHETLIVDTHVDVPYRLSEKMDDISVRTADGHFDYERAKEGGLDAPFMSIYIPASYQKDGGARELADELIDMVEKFEADWPDKFAVARSPEDVRGNFARGIISLPMGMENGAPIEDPESLRHFYDRGIRYITLTHSENNRICDSSYAQDRTWNGLSPFGEQVVTEMNRLGIMIDISHVSDEAFYDVLALTRAPVIASHSSCRKFTPGFERNMDDDMIRALAENGGVIQINFGSAFLRQDAQQQSKEYWETYDAYLEEQGLEDDDPRVRGFKDEYWKGRERIHGDLGDVVAQFDHVVGLVGVDHVGFGSDFDGVETLPEGLSDVSHYPDLIAALLDAGYSGEQIGKICSGNILRVWEQVERVAARLQQEG